MISEQTVKTVKEALNKMALYKAATGEEFSARAYDHAANIVSSAMVIRKILDGKSLPKGIGPKIRDFIIEIISLGFSKELSELRADPRISALERFQDIIGIGHVSALRLVSLGYTTLESLRMLSDSDKDGILTDMQKIGIKYHDKIIHRIPREMVSRAFEELRKAIPAESLVTGSYRRMAETSGDVDILVKSDTLKAYDIIWPQEVVLSAGPQKKSILWPVEPDKYVQVDVFISSKDSYIAYLNYSTGPFDHNIMLRTLAAKKGLRLNQYGLFNGKKKIPLSTEEDLYVSLGMKYLEPKDRH